MTRDHLVCVLLAVLLAACGGKAEGASASNDSGAEGSTDSGPESAVNDSGPDALPPDSGTATPPCPVDAPAQGSACPAAGLGCQYGANFSPSCIQVAQCTASGWNLTGPPGQCTPSVCPPSYLALTDGGLQSCASSLQVTDCWYPQGLCQCSAGLGGPAQPLGWYCVPVAPGCPYPTPAAGSPCTTPGQICGGTCGGAGVACDGGTWQANVEPCPV